MTSTLLLTGFEPFGSSTINPSAEVVRLFVDETLPALRVHTMILPVDCRLAPEYLASALHAIRPDWCLMLGEARSRSAVSLERVAVNLADFRIPDNGGHQPHDQPVVANGPAAYFVSLPVRSLVSAVEVVGAPVETSLSAGTYVCNYLLYCALHICTQHGLPTRCGFVHLPALPCQVTAGTTTAAPLPLETLYTAVKAMVLALGQIARRERSARRSAHMA